MVCFANTMYKETLETINGFTYQYLETGSGTKTLIFLHGLAAGKDGQQKNFDRLTTNNHCFFLDLPGHNGLSFKGIDNTDSLYEYLSNFISAKNITNPMLIGFSIGGLIAYDFSQKYLDKTGVTIPTVLWASPLYISNVHLKNQGKFGVYLLQLLPNWFIKAALVRKLYKFGLKITGITLPEEDTNALFKLDTGCIKIYKQFFTKPLYPKDPREKVLFIYGTNDVFTDQRLFDRLKLLSSHQQKYLIENGGHFCSEEQRIRSIQLIIDFLNT